MRIFLVFYFLGTLSAGANPSQALISNQNKCVNVEYAAFAGAIQSCEESISVFACLSQWQLIEFGATAGITKASYDVMKRFTEAFKDAKASIEGYETKYSTPEKPPKNLKPFYNEFVQARNLMNEREKLYKEGKIKLEDLKQARNQYQEKFNFYSEQYFRSSNSALRWGYPKNVAIGSGLALIIAAGGEAIQNGVHNYKCSKSLSDIEYTKFKEYGYFDPNCKFRISNENMWKLVAMKPEARSKTLLESKYLCDAFVNEVDETAGKIAKNIPTFDPTNVQCGMDSVKTKYKIGDQLFEMEIARPNKNGKWELIGYFTGQNTYANNKINKFSATLDDNGSWGRIKTQNAAWNADPNFNQLFLDKTSAAFANWVYEHPDCKIPKMSDSLAVGGAKTSFYCSIGKQIIAANHLTEAVFSLCKARSYNQDFKPSRIDARGVR